MLLCDHIWRDPSTGKWDLLGCFEWLHTDAEPARDIAFECYAQMTNLHGTYEFQLAVVRAQDEREIARYALGARVNAHDPLRRLQLGFCVTRLSLPAFGKYVLRLLDGGKVIHDLPIWLLPNGEQP
jgi:hypothetical protein